MKKYMLFAFVFLIIILAYVAFHWAVYFSAVKFFEINSIAIKNVLLWGMVFLGASFFLSTFLAHASDTVFSRGYYFLSGFWIGLLVNLFLFFAVVWGILWIGSWTRSSTDAKALAILAIIAAILYSVYGVYNALHPKITSIDVAIDQLPKQWVGKKIVQISDVHLGHIYRAPYMLSVVEKINALNPEIVVITGDLFDGTDGSLDSFLSPINKINAKVFFITGNHETYLGTEKIYESIAKTKIIPLRDSLQNVDGLQFIGIDYPLRGDNRDISKIIPAMPGWDQFAPSVLLIHEPVQTENAKKVGISLQLSGHTHKGQLFPFGFITSLVFKGYDYGFRREGSFAIYTSSGLGGWGPPMRTEKGSEIVEIKLR
jgi:predicted MPP superfamily phosphohydrolase